MINFRMLKLSDQVIWGCVLFLIAVGFASVFSVTLKMGNINRYDAFYYLGKQFGALLVGFVGMGFFAYLDYEHLKKFAWLLYILMIGLLMFVLLKGAAVYGAQRWIDIGPISFQPSEITKLVVIISLAVYFNMRKEKSSMIPVAILAGIPFALIFKQPDLGTALVIVAISLGMLVWNKTSPAMLTMVATPMLSLLFRPNIYVWAVYLIVLWALLYFSRVKLFDFILIMGLNIGVGVALPLAWGLLKDYQKIRIISFLNPGIDPHGSGYHTMQSLIAVGAGGIFGKGFLRGTQTQLHFIPEQHSDFIYSAIAEEWGLIGAIAVLAALFIIVRRAFIIADESRDYLGGILSVGAAVMIGFHTLVSVGMVLGVMPVVGIPLPFVSFGGTSLIINMILIGIIQSVAMRRHKLIF